jgi:hypothetical protein
MKRSFATVLFLLGGCGYSAGGRPDQANFTILASKTQIERFVQKLSKQFGDPETWDLIPGDDSSQIFRMDGSTATIIIVPEPDDRCASPKPNAPLRDTFNRGEHRIDLVYLSTSPAGRTSAKNTLIRAAHDEGLRITDFKKC